MTARGRLADVISFTECCNDGTTPDELLDAYRAEVLREAADWFDRYDTDSAAQLRRMAERSET